MHRLLRWLTSLTLAFAVAACGVGGGNNAEAPPASRIEAGPASVLLTGNGASRTLSAQLLVAAGAPVAGPIAWTSSDPAPAARGSPLRRARCNRLPCW